MAKASMIAAVLFLSCVRGAAVAAPPDDRMKRFSDQLQRLKRVENARETPAQANEKPADRLYRQLSEPNSQQPSLLVIGEAVGVSESGAGGAIPLAAVPIIRIAKEYQPPDLSAAPIPEYQSPDLSVASTDGSSGLRSRGRIALFPLFTASSKFELWVVNDDGTGLGQLYTAPSYKPAMADV